MKASVTQGVKVDIIEISSEGKTEKFGVIPTTDGNFQTVYFQQGCEINFYEGIIKAVQDFKKAVADCNSADSLADSIEIFLKKAEELGVDLKENQDG